MHRVALVVLGVLVVIGIAAGVALSVAPEPTRVPREDRFEFEVEEGATEVVDNR